jgi:hypothetical protein
MRQLGTEEKAALLLTADDDDDNEELMNSSRRIQNDNFPVITKRPKTYERHHSSNSHPVLCFTLILGAFILGCVSGVVIMLYRMSQEAEQGSPTGNLPQIALKTDLSIRTKLFQSITTTNFLNLNQ